MMFRVEKNVPDVYIQESRDFQLFARLYDLVFQSCRFNIDSMENVTDTLRCNDALLPLLSTKVGFFTKIQYTDQNYRYILAAFPYIIRYKGSLKGVQLVANLFENIMNITVKVEQSKDKQGITILFEEDSPPNVELFYNLLEYIRPTGMIIDYKVRTDLKFDSDFKTNDNIVVKNVKRLDLLSDKNQTSVVGSSLVTEENGIRSMVLEDNWNIVSNIGFAETLQTGSEVDNKPEEDNE